MKELHAVIGVPYIGALTYYVKRSNSMQNYPGVWSLLSIQFDPKELPDPMDRRGALPIFQRMSRERLGDVPISVFGYLSSGTCSDNPMKQRVTLHLYEIGLMRDPILNPAFYTEGGWLTPAEYKHRSEGATCGLCLRLWSDWCYRHGFSDERFAPEPLLED